SAMIGLVKTCSSRDGTHGGWTMNLPGSCVTEVMTMMGLFTWLQRVSPGIAMRKLGPDKRFRPSRSAGCRPCLEVLEGSLAPATNSPTLASGAGSLDHFLSPTNGTITTGEDPGDTAATLSLSALQAVGAGVSINIAADNAITFQDLGTLNLKTGHGVS